MSEHLSQSAIQISEVGLDASVVKNGTAQNSSEEKRTPNSGEADLSPNRISFIHELVYATADSLSFQSQC